MRVALIAAACAVACAAVPAQAATPLGVSYSVFATGTSTLTTCGIGSCTDAVSAFSGTINQLAYFPDFDGDDMFSVSTMGGFFLGQEAVYSGRITGTINPLGNGLSGSDFSYFESNGKQCAGQITCAYTTIRLSAGSFSVAQLSPAPVPEPASWAMLIAGFSVVGLAMRRRRQTNSLGSACIDFV